MSFGTRLESVLNVVLRVPPLFVIDEILRTLAYPTSQTPQQPEIKLSNNAESYRQGLSMENDEVHRVIIMLAIKIFGAMFGTALSLFVFVLWTEHLVGVYLNLVPLGIVFASYRSNVNAMAAVLSATNSGGYQSSILEDILSLKLSNLLHEDCPATVVGQNLVLQCFLNFFFRKANFGVRNPTLQRLVLLSCVAPSFLMMLPMPNAVIRHSAVFAALIPLSLSVLMITKNIAPAFQALGEVYKYMRRMLTNVGMAAVIETEWNRLNVPCVLRTFWLLRAAEHAATLLVEHFGVQGESMPLVMVAYQISKSLLSQGCETMTAVLGMTSVISYTCHYLGCLFQWVLLTEEDEEKPIGTVSALLFIVLALQTGLTGLDPEKRLVRLCRNFCLLFTAILHFFHNIVNPVLISLSASHSSALHRHARALLACAFLVIFPTSMLVYLWSHQQVNHWLLAVSAFSMQVVAKVAVSLMIYSIFLIDAYRGTFWEKMDDYVFYVRVFGHTIDFLFGIFLFFNGACILIYESGGAIRALTICLHAYVNIWCEARKGWRTFTKRRTAVNKINALPDASVEQLSKLDDVCSICYQEMRSAKKTFCHHFFHGVCLRKWLYVQDHCPLCNEILYKGATAENNAH